jgi:signal transduction histidine kinase
VAAVARTVEATIGTVMINGRGDLGADALETLGALPDFRRVQVYRTSGTAAFQDLDTLHRVVARLRLRDQADRAEELARHLVDRVDHTIVPARLVDADFAHAARTGTPVSRDEQLNGEDVLTYFLPMRNDRICQECHGDDHRVRGVLVLSVATTPLKAGLYRGFVTLAGALVVTAFAIAAGLVWSLRRVVLRPIETLVDGLNSDDPGQALAGIPPSSTQEFSDLARALRESVERARSAQAAVAHSEKMAGLGQLAGGIAHDFNNLLTVIGGHAQLMLATQSREAPAYHNVEMINTAAQRGAALIRQLLAFSRRQVLEPKVLDLNTVVRGMETMVPWLLGTSITVTVVTGARAARVKADSAQMDQILMNLVVNARDAMGDEGTLTIETADVEIDESYAREHTGMAAGAYVLLAVTDTGCGIDAATRDRIFEPFFTTKGPGKGTGLGLSTVYGMVMQSGGHIAVVSEPGRGTTFKIYLPLVEATTEDAGTVEAPVLAAAIR